MGCSASVDTTHHNAAHPPESKPHSHSNIPHLKALPNRTPSGGIEDVSKVLELTELEQNQHDLIVHNWDARIKNLPHQDTTLTERQKELLRASWKNLELDFKKAAEMFYGHLFLIYPTSQPLFHRSHKNYEKMALSMFKTCVNGIDNMDLLANNIRMLGSRHTKYHSGERREYILIGECFLFTLQNMNCDNEKYTDEVEEAWFRVYNFVADLMMSGYTETRLKESQA